MTAKVAAAEEETKEPTPSLATITRMKSFAQRARKSNPGMLRRQMSQRIVAYREASERTKVLKAKDTTAPEASRQSRLCLLGACGKLGSQDLLVGLQGRRVRALGEARCCLLRQGPEEVEEGRSPLRPAPVGVRLDRGRNRLAGEGS